MALIIPPGNILKNFNNKINIYVIAFSFDEKRKILTILISVIELTGKRTDVTLADFHKRLLKELQKKFHDGSSVTEAKKTTENFTCDEKKKKKKEIYISYMWTYRGSEKYHPFTINHPQNCPKFLS